MQISEDKISFVTANFVGRALDYSLRPFNWGKADEATQRLFHGDTFEEEFSEIMRIILDAGFKTIELWVAHLNYDTATQEQIQKARQILEHYNLSVCSYAGGFGNSEEEVEKSFQLAQAMGAKVLAGGLNEKLLDRAYSLCREYKIRLAFENHPDRETPEKIKQLIGGRKDWFGACVDTGWFATFDIDASQAIHKLGEKVFHVHLKDIKAVGKHETCALGDGIVNIPAVISALEEIEYDGYISIEHEPEYHEPMEDIKKSLGCLREWLRK
jgi:sugar phosphate isomerase/epimerase